jgi:ABC-2 type transport system ATP-binding protein
MIQAEELCKTYHLYKRIPGKLLRSHSTIAALTKASFTIARGEIVGYIGPNGAGKSTTIKILSGILHPDKDGGHCLVDGQVPWKNRQEHVRRIGVVFGQKTQLWWDLPAADSLDLLADMYRVSRSDRIERTQRLRRELDLDAFIDTPVRQLSLGQRMRCELAAALIHNPPLLFLDEPSIGLDAPSKIALRNFVRWLNNEYGTTIILTTHDMDDIEALAQRVLLIGKGAILFDGTMQGLRREAGNRKHIILDLQSPANPDQLQAFYREHGLELLECYQQRLVLAFDPDVLNAGTAIQLAIKPVVVADLSITFQPVEELISTLYKRHNL